MRSIIVIILHYFDGVVLLCMHAHVCYKMVSVPYENLKLMLLPWAWQLKLIVIIFIYEDGATFYYYLSLNLIWECLFQLKNNHIQNFKL